MSDTHMDPMHVAGPAPQAGPPIVLPTRGRGRLIAAIAVVAVAVAVGIALLAPIPVTIDGTMVWVPRGGTVAALAAQGRLSGTNGDLMSVKGVVLRKDAGGLPTVHVDGEIATATTPVGFGDRITSAHGADVVEKTVTRIVETTPSVQFLGTGPVSSVEESGTPGKTKVVVGAISGEEVSRRVVSRGRPMTVRREPAYKGVKAVALTFDDGPWPGSTDAVLARLKTADAKATFFMLGRQVKNRPELAARVLAAGMEVGDHSYSHKLLAHAPRKVVTSEIAWGADAIKNALGIRPVWYRPAGGSTSGFVYREAKRLGLRVVLWTIDPHDYLKPGARVIARRVLNNVRPGAVILMHDGGGDRSQTVAALKIVLHGLKARGYSMVTMSQLYR
jgi:peptidoglycan/xylan/chitin deacetylase (PgdA/CDA1 family)